MSECVFCDIVAGEVPAHRLFEDEHTLAFLDAAPVAPGHALIIPKAHHVTLTDMDTDLTAEVFRTVRRVAAAVEAVVEPDGFNVTQSNGAAAGQDVFHVHVHVVPRYEDDEVRVHWPREDLSEEEQGTITDSIRENLY